MKPTIRKEAAEFIEETEYVYIECDDFTVRVEVPRGHLIEDIDVEVSYGEGWEEFH